MLAKTTLTIALCSVANFINAADRVILPIAIISMTEEYEWDLHWQGWILSAFAFGYITSQLFGANTARQFGGKVVLTFAVSLWSFSTLLTPFIASSAYLLIAARIALGLGEGLGLPTIFHIFANNVPLEERSRAFGYLVSFGSIGQVAGSLICPYLPWKWMFIVFGLMGILWVIVFLLVYSDVTNKTDEEVPFICPKVNNRNIRLSEYISHWPLWAIYFAHFSMNWSNYIIMQWLPTYFTRHLGASKEDISFTAVPYVFNSFFGIMAGHFADFLISKKWTVLSVRRLMTFVGLIGPGAFLLCFSTVNNLLTAVIFVSISMGFCSCNSSGHLSNHADVAPNHAGITFAVSNSLATIPGILCGPLTAELVTKSEGRWFPVFVLAGAVNFVGAIIYHSQSSASQVI